MSFSHGIYFIPLLILLVIYFMIIRNQEKKYFNWVQDHWFYKRSFLSKISTLFYFIGISLICLALLDLRGPEKRVKGNSIDQKTIILIDSSASMLAEDVRPNRFNKALLLVKHYIKKAVGQQISLVVFSDRQKRIIPFTDDMDLIKARINRLETMDLNRGGTGLSQAIQESIQYFRNNSDSKEVVGNILIFTDAEETEFGFDIQIPNSITVGVIGVGTLKGAPIPLRSKNGSFRGNKRFEGKEVITKLDENFLKKMGSIIKNYRYWIATSYSLPTEQILSFFSKINKVKQSENEFRIKPVLADYLILPGMLLLLLSVILKYFKVLIPALTVILFVGNSVGHTQEKKEKKPEKTEKTIMLEAAFAKNELSHKGKLALASYLLKDGFSKESKVLFEEILGPEINPQNIQDYFNYALALIKEKEKTKGIRVYNSILDKLDKYTGENIEALSENVRKNVLKALDEQQGGGKGKSDKKDQQEQDKKDQKSGKNGKSDQENKDDQKQDQNEKDGENKDNKQNQSKDNKKSDDKKDKDGDKDKKVQKKKIPAILKQLLSDDNNLQKKLIDAKTIERKSRKSKDW